MNPFHVLKLSGADSRSPAALQQAAPTLEALGAQEIVRWAVQQYPTGLVLASSFGAEDMVLIDMLARVAEHPTIFYLDTGLLFPETYELINQAEERYGFKAVRVATDMDLGTQAVQYGDALWATNPDQCCQIRKVLPLQQYLKDQIAWITGIRRDQTAQRKSAPVVGWDDRHQLVKLNPLAAWSAKDVFRYLVKNQVPYNPLHDYGYLSIGCVPCTRPIKPGENPRAGRWAGQEKTECGLHL